MKLLSELHPSRVLHNVFVTRGDVSPTYRAIRHLVAGGLGTLIYLAGVTAQVELFAIHPVIAVVIATLLLDVYTYAISRVWVYKATRDHGYAVPRFIAILVIALALNSGIMFVTVDILDLWYVWALVAATIIVPATNFLLSYLWAFR